MSMRLSLMFCLAIATAMPAGAGVENQVREMVLAGEIMPFEAIRNRVQSQIRGELIGSDFDAGTLTYRFRFLVDGNVINVDVDARTGQRRRPGRY